MGYKLVRDHNEEWCRSHGVSGQWRTSPDPASALLRKIFEEAGEYAEHRDPGELYDLLDVVQAAIGLRDPDGKYAARHRAKVAEMGGFTRFAEWCPVPPVIDLGYMSLPAEVQAAIEGREEAGSDG
jgi:predicted house-cleaning noncanonical NTP pyrophosphatase (MazG superfamily)